MNLKYLIAISLTLYSQAGMEEELREKIKTLELQLEQHQRSSQEKKSILEMAQPYISRESNHTLKAIYASKYSLKCFATSPSKMVKSHINTNTQIFEQRGLLPAEAIEYTKDWNYLMANFFVAGDIGDLGIGESYRDTPISFTMGNTTEQNSTNKPILWKTPKATELEGLTHLDQVTSQTHAEIQFIKDWNSILTQDSQSALNLILDLMSKGGNKEIHSYGFMMDSIFDMSNDCIDELHTFITSRDQKSLIQMIEQNKKTRDCLKIKAEPSIIFHSRGLYSGSDLIYINNGTNPFQLEHGPYNGTLSPLKKIYEGRLDLKFEYRHNDQVYFEGKKIPLPKIILMPYNFFAPNCRQTRAFNWKFSTDLTQKDSDNQ